MEWLAPEVSSGSTALPVPLTVVREWVRESSDNDALLEPTLRAAQSFVENYTGLYLTPVTVKMRADAFPIGDSFPLPKGPVRSLTAIKYRADDGTMTTWSADNYRVLVDGIRSHVELVDGANWPDHQASLSAVEVEAAVGYADWNTVPRDVQTAVMMLLARFWMDREAGDPPAAVYALLANHRVRSL